MSRKHTETELPSIQDDDTILAFFAARRLPKHKEAAHFSVLIYWLSSVTG